MMRVLSAVLRTLPQRNFPWAMALRSTWDNAVGSLVLVCAAVGFVGAAMCWQAAWQARRIMGDQSFIGPEFLVIMTQEFTPLMVGVMLAARSGGGLAASLGTRRFTQQLDALVLMGDDPVRLLVAPHVLGGFLAAAILAAPALVVGELAGALTMYVTYAVEPRTFIAFGALRAGDLVFSLVKSAAFGAAVMLLGARAGLHAQPSAEGVGMAATRGVVEGATAVLILDAVLDAFRFATGFP